MNFKNKYETKDVDDKMTLVILPEIPTSRGVLIK